MSDKSSLDKVSLHDVPITVLGLGHIGLPTALGFAEFGRMVIGADSDPAKVALIRAGQPPFYEPGLSNLLAKHLQSGKFQPIDDVEAAVQRGSIIFICVGTPQRENGQADLAQVEAVAQVVARNLNGYKLIVEKSTVPAITGQWLKRTISRYS
ncbi:MAG: UDP-glucose 6-dehydrogenase, partial [Acidobacteriia bacterium]|nr:UDP-glucose 6-dehydrogenase [Terriglobia bacterium]